MNDEAKLPHPACISVEWLLRDIVIASERSQLRLDVLERGLVSCCPSDSNHQCRQIHTPRGTHTCRPNDASRVVELVLGFPSKRIQLLGALPQPVLVDGVLQSARADERSCVEARVRCNVVDRPLQRELQRRSGRAESNKGRDSGHVAVAEGLDGEEQRSEEASRSSYVALGVLTPCWDGTDDIAPRFSISRAASRRRQATCFKLQPCLGHAANALLNCVCLCAFKS